MFGDWNNHFPKEINHLHFPLFFVRKKKTDTTNSALPSFLRHAKNFASERLGERMNMHENSLVDQTQAFRWVGSWSCRSQKMPGNFACSTMFNVVGRGSILPNVRFGSSEASSIFHGLRSCWGDVWILICFWKMGLCTMEHTITITYSNL